MLKNGMEIFDVDHTITRRSSGRHFVMQGIRLGFLPSSLYLTLPLYYLKYRLGGPFFRNMDRELNTRGFPELEDRDWDEIEQVCSRSFEEGLKGDIFAQAFELIHGLRSAGRQIVLATSSLDIVIKPLADFLGVTEIIATRLEFLNGRCTGRFLSPPLFGEEKKRRVVDYVERRGGVLGNCSFYSDSFHDLPLLEAVGRPVAVNPDHRLRRTAKKRNWEILRLR
jgi:HAD superfamily hydrolase (TIGR01490 family)